MSRTTVVLAVASQQGPSCGRIGLAGEGAKLRSSCSRQTQRSELEEEIQTVLKAGRGSELLPGENKQTNENNKNNNKRGKNNSHASSQRQCSFPLCHADPGGGHGRPFPACSIPPSTKIAPGLSFCPRGLCNGIIIVLAGLLSGFLAPRIPQPQVQSSPAPPRRRQSLGWGNCKTQTAFLGSQMPINPGVYCSAPRQPLFYGCAFKNKSSVRPNWLQNGSSTKRTTRLGDGKSCHGPNRTATKWDFCEPHTGRNSCPAFKYIWCESMWSLRHHTSHQEGKIWTWKAASLGSTTALGRDVGFGAAVATWQLHFSSRTGWEMALESLGSSYLNGATRDKLNSEPMQCHV